METLFLLTATVDVLIHREMNATATLTKNGICPGQFNTIGQAQPMDMRWVTCPSLEKERKMKITGLILVSILAGVFVAGCGGDDDNDSSKGATIDLPASSSTLASELEEEDAVSLCVSISDAGADVTEAVVAKTAGAACILAGVSEAALTASESDATDDDVVTACEDAVSECEDDMSSEEDDTDADGDAMTTKEMCEEGGTQSLENCDAPIGDIKDCLEWVFKTATDSLDKIDLPACGDLSIDYFDVEGDNTEADTEDTSDDEVEMSDACTSLVDECSAFGGIIESYKVDTTAK